MPLVRHDAALFQDQLQSPYIGDVVERIGGDHNQVGERHVAKLAHLGEAMPCCATVVIVVRDEFVRSVVLPGDFGS